MKAFLSNDSTFSQIENRLNKYPFLSKNHLPGYPDALVFLALTQMHKHPHLKQHPHFYHWFILIKQFNINTVRSWLTRESPSPEDHLIHHLLSFESLPQKTNNHASVLQPNQSIATHDSETAEQIAETKFLLDVWEGENRIGRWESMKRELLTLGVRVERDILGGQTRLSFNGDSERCEEVLEVVDKWLEYRSIQVKKQRQLKGNQ